MLRRIYNFIKSIIWSIYYKTILLRYGHKTQIDRPLQIRGGGYIEIGSNVLIQYKSWIECNPMTGVETPILCIMDGCIIGHFNEIYATQSIIIEKNVLTADRVYISDNLHGFADPNIPILNQPIIQNGTVRIGEGSWLGVGVAVLGANIGKHCVIGANAVVTHDIPDYSVAVGIPAKVIKRYNFLSQRWERTNPDGSFIE